MMSAINPDNSGDILTELPEEIKAGYTDIKQLPNGELIGILRLMFHWTVHVGIDFIGYRDRYCFDTYELAKQDFDNWNIEEEPKNWHRHPSTGRRRDITTGKEWIDW